jgi:four helix bundle protein
MSYQFTFEKLVVWHEARCLVKEIYLITESLPPAEKFGLVLQMRRGGISVVSNLAEGSARTSQKDQAHFYQMAYSSLLEILNQAIIANDLGFINDSCIQTLREMISKISNKINNLRKKCLET